MVQLLINDVRIHVQRDKSKVVSIAGGDLYYIQRWEVADVLIKENQTDDAPLRNAPVDLPEGQAFSLEDAGSLSSAEVRPQPLDASQFGGFRGEAS